jgi:hypothetical protein
MVHVARRRATVVPAPGDVPQVAEPPPIKTDPIRPSAAPAPGKIVFPRLQRNNPVQPLHLSNGTPAPRLEIFRRDP